MTGFSWGGEHGATWGGEHGGTYGVTEPTDPVDLSAEAVGTETIALEWTTIGAPEHLNVYRSRDSSDDLADYDLVAEATGESYTDDGLTNGRSYHYRVTAVNSLGESGPTNDADATTDLDAPEPPALDNSEEREITLEWSLNDNNDEGETVVYRDGDELATLDRDTTEYVDDDDIRDGREYEYYLYRDTEQNSAEGPSDVTIAYLPDAEGLSLDGTEPEELDTEWSSTLNNGEYRLEYRDDDPDGDHPGYEHEATTDYDGDLEHTIEDVLDGEQFSVRLRTQTEYVEGDWLEADEITKLRSADGLGFDDVEATSLELSWTNNSTFDGSNKVHRRRLYPDHDGQWRLIGTVSSGSEAFEDDSVTPDVEYEYYVQAQSQWVSSDSDSSTTETEDIGLSHRAVPPRGWHVSIEHPSGQPLTPAILSDGTRLEPTLNGQPQATIDIPRDEAYLAEALEGAEMLVWKDGDRRPIDELEDVVIETDRDELIGYGGVELEQDVSIDVDDQPAHELVEELIEEYTGMRINVDEPDVEVSEDVIVADPSGTTELEEILDEWPFGDDVPIRLEDNQIELLDTCDIVDLSGSAEDEQYSGGSADDGSSIQSSHSFEYTIPGEHIGLAVREGVLESDVPDVDYFFNGEEIATLGHGEEDSPEWTDSLSSVVPETDIDEADFGAFEDSGTGDDPYIIDCVAVYDQRYHDVEDFSEEVHEPDGYLNQPYNKPPDGVELETETLAQFRRAIAGALEVETNDPDGLLKLELSANNGRDWLEAEDVALLEGEFDEAGPYLRARLTLGAVVDEPQDATPRFGYEGQTVDSIEIRADFDNTPLVINHEDEGELGETIATIAEQADAVYEIWQDDDETVFEYTHPGQRETSRADAIADYSVTKHNRRVLKCKVKGANAPVRGERIDVDELDTTYSLSEDDVVRGKEEVRDEDGDRLRVGLDYELHGSDGELEVLEGGRVEEDETIEIDYEYTVSGTFEHEDYGGDLREKETVNIPAARSERAAEQAAKVIVDEASVPRWEADVTIAYEDVQDIRLSDTLDLEDVPGEAEVVREIDDEGSESGLQLRLGNRQQVSETVSQIQSQLSSASDLV